MKNLNIAVLLAAVVISAVYVSCNGIPVKGNGNLVTFERTVLEFEKINSSVDAEVRFHAGKEYRIVITVDSNLEEYVEIETKNNVLNIRTQNGSYLFTKFLVDVYCPVLKGVSISGSGSFSGNDKIIAASFEAIISGSGSINGIIECDDYTVNISGSGKVNVSITCNNLSADLSGSGNIIITGTGNNSNVRISGSGKFNGIDYKSNNVTARISGSGNMNIWAVESINAIISGSGSIKYRGTPKIDFNGSGSGQIRSE
ncbi:MAG: DUF2807 domain-containing protein [Treponema sp.]|nr:DUF2807 domain-containing protein [Treponema sp.]